MANFITLLRLILFTIAVFFAFVQTQFGAWAMIILGAIALHLDMLDGWIARTFNCSTPFGEMFDVVADRIIEITAYTVLAFLGWVPIWVPLVFIYRGGLVDLIKLNSISQQKTNYSRFGYFIVKGAFIRTLYGFVKGYTLCWIGIMKIIMITYPEHWSMYQSHYLMINQMMIYSTMFLCLLRAIPVFSGFFSFYHHFDNQPRKSFGAG